MTEVFLYLEQLPSVRLEKGDEDNREVRGEDGVVVWVIWAIRVQLWGRMQSSEVS